MLNPTNQTELTHADAVEISKTWILLLISGLISVIVGIIILRVHWTKDDLALVVAILFILRGLFRAIVRPIDGSGRGWNVFVGALEVAVGIALSCVVRTDSLGSRNIHWCLGCGDGYLRFRWRSSQSTQHLAVVAVRNLWCY